MQTAVVKFDSDFCVFREEILRTRYYPKKYRFVDWYVPPSVDWYSSDYYYRQVQCLVYESGVSSLSLVRRHALTDKNNTTNVCFCPGLSKNLVLSLRTFLIT
jgi:hypothetical protein